MARRQRSTVQGRIENGTLFPNISFKIQTDLEQHADRILSGLQKKVLEILHAIQSDLELALGQAGDTDSAGGDPRELKQRQEKLKEVLRMLKRRHENILKRISL